ncbi:MAG: adenosylmethionine--8-amino-7-oxononanoate transaminase [Micavibrio sp.]|nr:adenosylmethionine--8-amino-7-oxononanoate transaminase [Micavibrio sp.]
MSRVSPLWHPMTQHKTAGPMINIDRAEGIYLYSRDSRDREHAIIDGISSWWVNTHGHSHPKIVEAVQQQAAQLEQVIFAGFTHAPAEKLTRHLLAHIRSQFEGVRGSPLEFCFYSDSGSTAIEVALKMAIGYFGARNEKRTKIMALEGGYHGDTFGAMAAGARGVFTKPFEHYLFEVNHMPFPEAGQESKALSQFERFLKEHGHETAAFVFEPLVQGSVGMRVYSPMVLQEMAKMCRDHGVLLIADEVMTGFGRTGSMFACSQAGFMPDMMCLSKGLTAGFLPMGVTLANRHIYKAYYSERKEDMFMHSTSFTGNALACAAALANLQIWEDEPVMERVEMIESCHRRAAGWFGARPDVKDVRVKGSIFAVEIAVDIEADQQGYLSNMAQPLYDFMLSHDILLRPMGNVVYILPPYCIKSEELDHIYETLWKGLDMLRDMREAQEDGHKKNREARIYDQRNAA